METMHLIILKVSLIIMTKENPDCNKLGIKLYYLGMVWIDRCPIYVDAPLLVKSIKNPKKDAWNSIVII